MTKIERDTDGIIQQILKFHSMFKFVEFLKSKLLIFRLTCDKNRASHRWRQTPVIKFPSACAREKPTRNLIPASLSGKGWPPNRVTFQPITSFILKCSFNLSVWRMGLTSHIVRKSFTIHRPNMGLKDNILYLYSNVRGQFLDPRSNNLVFWRSDSNSPWTTVYSPSWKCLEAHNLVLKRQKKKHDLTLGGDMFGRRIVYGALRTPSGPQKG